MKFLSRAPLVACDYMWASRCVASVKRALGSIILNSPRNSI